MSREIKFRIWDREEERYYKDSNNNGEDFIALRQNGGLVECSIWIEDSIVPIDGKNNDERDKYIIEQHTGLKDKNGKEIYEGDIVKAKIDGLWQTGAHTVSEGKATWNLEVVYNDIRYMDVFHILGSKNQPNRIYYLFDESISDIEVIGNIYENPELLGGEE